MYVDVYSESNHEEMNESIMDAPGIFTVNYQFIIRIAYLLK